MSDTAEFHSPEDLLATARSLLASEEPGVLRAAVLEAVTALEAMTSATVFPLLRTTLPGLLVGWLEDRTRMDFDTRLGVLTPVATGRDVDKDSHLWSRYKRARSIRNGVTHLGRRVSREEAEEVLATVEQWIQFLGSTAEVSLSMEAIRDQIAALPEDRTNEQDVLWRIADYYRSARGAEVVHEPDFGGQLRPDAVLRFGQDLVVIELKVARDAAQAMNAYRGGLHQAEKYLETGRVGRVAVFIVFVGLDVPEQLQTVRTGLGGKVSMIGVRIR